MKKSHGYWNETLHKFPALNEVQKITFRVVINTTKVVEPDILKQAAVLLQIIKLVHVLVEAHESEEEILYSKIKKWSYKYVAEDIAAATNIGNYSLAVHKLENATLFIEGRRDEALITQSNSRLLQPFYLKEQISNWRKLLEAVTAKTKYEAKVDFTTTTEKFIGTQYRILLSARVQAINAKSEATWDALQKTEDDVHEKEQKLKLHKNIHWSHL